MLSKNTSSVSFCLCKKSISVISHIAAKLDEMTKVKSGDTMQLRYALNESECTACSSHLEWQLDLKDINRPRYVSYHCNYQYVIYIDNVKVDVKRVDRKKQESLENKPVKDDEPRAILIAQTKKKERQRQEKDG